jgi:redox-sensitive bicupin YhaK (pirin superfamily)
VTSTGTGVSHSEYNRNKTDTVRFLQIWGTPNKSRLPPNYFTRHFSDAEKTNKLVKIVAPVGTEGVVEEREGSGPTPVSARYDHLDGSLTLC